MKRFWCAVIYLLLGGMLYGSVLNSRYEKCGVAENPDNQDAFFAIVIWPAYFGAAFIIEQKAIGSTPCKEERDNVDRN